MMFREIPACRATFDKESFLLLVRFEFRSCTNSKFKPLINVYKARTSFEKHR